MANERNRLRRNPEIPVDMAAKTEERTRCCKSSSRLQRCYSSRLVFILAQTNKEILSSVGVFDETDVAAAFETCRFYF